MKNSSLKLVYIFLGIISIGSLLVFDYLTSRIDAISFFEIVNYTDTYLLVLPIISIIAVCIAAFKNKLNKVLPIAGIIIHFAYVYVIMWMGRSRIAIDQGLGFYLAVASLIGMTVLAFLNKNTAQEQ